MEADRGSDQMTASGSGEVKRTSKDKSKVGALAIEFEYYGGVISNVEPALTDSGVRALAVDWKKKLFEVGYHVERLRDKRNRYLAGLTINMINDKMTGIFDTVPPDGPLPEIDELSIITSGEADWEKDSTWSEFYSAIPEVTDEEFWFLLYQIRPCAAIMPCPYSKSKVIHWIYTLCRLSAKKCFKMKTLRNDYAYSLLSYVIDLKVAGPFEDSPPRRKLPPLAEIAKYFSTDKKKFLVVENGKFFLIKNHFLDGWNGSSKIKIAEKYPITSPYNCQANSFMDAQPALEEGAICYVAVTGNQFDPNTLLPR